MRRWRSAADFSSLAERACGRNRCRELSMTRCVRRAFCAGTPYIDAGEQEQPHDVDEVPIPGGKFETEMLGRGEVTEIDADQAHDQECRADDNVRAMKAGRHEKGGTVNVAAEIEPG